MLGRHHLSKYYGVQPNNVNIWLIITVDVMEYNIIVRVCAVGDKELHKRNSPPYETIHIRQELFLFWEDPWHFFLSLDKKEWRKTII